MDIGREEGYTVAKEAFDGMLVKIEARDTPKASTGDANIQTDPPIATTTSVSTQTDPPTTATASSSVQTNPSALVTTSQFPELTENRKNAKIHFTSENSPNVAVFSSQKPSVSVLDAEEPSTTITALKTRSTAANFTENHQKVENLSILPPKTPQTLSPSTVEHLNDIARVHTSQLTLDDVNLWPLTHTTTASSSKPSQPPVPPPSTEHPKSKFLCTDFESQLPQGSPAPTCITTGLKSHSESPNFVVNCQKVKKYPSFTQKYPESLISTRFNWADDASTLPIIPTVSQQLPRNLSCLRSTAPNPFSSLRRRRGNPKKRWNAQHHCHGHSESPGYSFSRYHSSRSHTPFRVPISLDWNQDPRLIDLGAALRALGWIRACQ